MRLYPPAPSINREPIEPETWRDLQIPLRAQVLVMPWTVHRHRRLWDQPDAFMPSRFHPGNRGQDRPVPIPAVRRRPAHLYRCELRHAGSGDRAGRAAVALSVRQLAGDPAMAGTEVDDAAAGRSADARRRPPLITSTVRGKRWAHGPASVAAGSRRGRSAVKACRHDAVGTAKGPLRPRCGVPSCD